MSTGTVPAPSRRKRAHMVGAYLNDSELEMVRRIKAYYEVGCLCGVELTHAQVIQLLIRQKAQQIGTGES